MNIVYLKLCSKIIMKVLLINKLCDNWFIESEVNVKFLGLFFGLILLILKVNNEKVLNGFLFIYIL